MQQIHTNLIDKRPPDDKHLSDALFADFDEGIFSSYALQDQAQNPRPDPQKLRRFDTANLYKLDLMMPPAAFELYNNIAWTSSRPNEQSFAYLPQPHLNQVDQQAYARPSSKTPQTTEGAMVTRTAVNTHKKQEDLQGRKNSDDSQKGKKMKREEKVNSSNNSSISNKEIAKSFSVENLSSIKGNIKNTYIKKINSLIQDPKLKDNTRLPSSNSINNLSLYSPDEVTDAAKLSETSTGNNSSNSLLKKIRSCDAFKFSNDGEKTNVKLARNRESARNSRKRKKMYIELLESKVSQMTTELDQSTRLLEADNTYLNKIYSNNKLANSMIVNRHSLCEKMENKLKAKTPEEEIAVFIDALQMRLGSTGKERMQSVSYFANQIVEILLPVHMKYLLWTSSSQSEHLNGGNQAGLYKEGFWRRVLRELNLTPQQIQDMVNYKELIQRERRQFEKCILDFQKEKANLLGQVQLTQQVMDEIRRLLTPMQQAIFLAHFKEKSTLNTLGMENLWQCLGSQTANGDPMGVIKEEDLDNVNYFDMNMEPPNPEMDNVENSGANGEALGFDYESLCAGLSVLNNLNANNNGNTNNANGGFGLTKVNESTSERDSSDEYYDEEESLYHRRKKQCINPGSDSPFNVQRQHSKRSTQEDPNLEIAIEN